MSSEDEKLKEELEKLFKRVLAVRYGIEILKVERQGDMEDTYITTASIDTDYLEDSSINEIYIIVMFSYEPDDTSSDIAIHWAVVQIPNECQVVAIDIDEFKREFKLSTTGLAYRIVL
jgi:hypothetical protein